MKHRIFYPGIIIIITAVMLSSCSTLSVSFPEDMYVSAGDYTEQIQTKGVVQVHKHQWTPFFVLYDLSEVREDLYKQLLKKVENMQKVV